MRLTVSGAQSWVSVVPIFTLVADVLILSRLNVPGIRRRLGLAFITLVSSAAAILLVAYHPERILAGDPAVYRLRVGEIAAGGIPYLEVPFEHLPITLVPMWVAWYLGGADSQTAFIVVFAAQMAVALALTTVTLDHLGVRLGTQRAGWKFVALVLPILPLVVFRNDSVPVLLGVVALLLLAADRWYWWVMAATGAFAKIWPAASAFVGWAHRRWEAVAVAVSGAAALGLTILPGFTEARDAAGLHAETLAGAFVGLTRTLGGHATEVAVTTAAYIAVPTWVVAANAAVGVFLFAVGVLSVRSATSLREGIVATGTVVVGVILSSSLLSLQFGLWVLPFVALARRAGVVLVGFGLCLLTVGIAWTWSEAVLQGWPFYAALTARNLMLVGVGLLMARDGEAARVS